MFDISRVLAGIQSAFVDLILFSCLIISGWSLTGFINRCDKQMINF